MECEAEASSVSIFEPVFTSDILRTDAYAEVLDRVFHAASDPGILAHKRNLRARRMAYMLGKHGPALHIILDESVLHRAVGGEMLPLNRRFEPMKVAINGLKRLITAGQADADPVMYLGSDEHLTATDAADKVASYQTAFQELAARVPGPEHTNEMLDEVIAFNDERRARDIRQAS